MTRNDVKAQFPDATKEQIDALMDIHSMDAWSAKKIGIEPRRTYTTYTDALRALHRMLEPQKTDLEYALELFDKTPYMRYTDTKRTVETIKVTDPSRWMQIAQDVENALATLSKSR